MTFIIAEAGVNHNGDLRNAREMIYAASYAGADAVKFQTFDPERLEPPGPMREFLKSVALSRKDHYWLARECDVLGIEFMSTPFDVDSLRFLVDDLKVKTLKIASGNLENKALLRAADRSKARQVLISTGAATIAQVVTAIGLMQYQTPILMHCVSAYPVPADEANLRVIETQRQYCGGDWGYSDHTLGITAPIMAVALGAKVIEKHFTLDRRASGPDHKASLEPGELKQMVRAIREAEQMLGDGCKRPMPCEQSTMETMRRRREWAGRS